MEKKEVGNFPGEDRETPEINPHQNGAPSLIGTGSGEETCEANDATEPGETNHAPTFTKGDDITRDGKQHAIFELFQLGANGAPAVFARNVWVSVS
ncbi:MAG: hypothetical protein KDA84_24715 [Planctomycetaceae bacterium]|nr:hypothetical protein [Planctomycetaceae bacterium]